MTLQKRLSGWTLFSLLVLFLAGMAWPQAAPQAEQQQPAAAAAAPTEFEGKVVIGLGKYFYLPAAKGYDIVVQGKIQGQDAGFLDGKDVRVKGAMLKDEPSVFAADSIDIKDPSGQYQNAFTRTEDVKLDDYLDTNERAAFQALIITKADKSEDWEGKGQGKIYGKLTPEKTIVLTDDKGKEIGKVLVDNVTDFANYYIKKLRLFDMFWFYLNIKDTVDVKVRRKTRELFHADILCAGLY